jgi:hypothetical protein
MHDHKKPAIEWTQLTQREFDRVVELVVQLEYGENATVLPIDGRGGDGGIDILVTHPDGRSTIFQLKFFLDGFSGRRNGHRRSQITASLEAALVHSPDRWVLVVPAVPTRNDYAYITTLQGENGPRIELWHRAKLDALLVKHPTVVDVMRRDPALLEYAVTASMEKAVLAGGGDDLAERVARLGTVVDAVDPRWTLDFAREGSVVTRTLRAKHRDAPTLSPITLHFSTELDQGHAALQRDMARTLGFGLAGTVRLPGHTVKNFRVDGPPLVRRAPTDGMELSWTVPPNTKLAGIPVTVTLTDTDGQHIATQRGKAIDGSPGSMGASLQVCFHDTLTLTYLIPHRREEACQLDMAYDPSGATRSPALVRSATQMVFDLSSAVEMTVSVNGNQFLRARATADFALPDADDWLAELRDLHDLADDLEVINRATGNDVPIPASMTTTDRIYFRCVRLMLDGYCVMAPDVKALNLILRANLDVNDPGLRQVLDEPEGQFLITHEPWAPTVAGHELHLPDACLWHPRMALRDRAKVRSTVCAGKAIKASLDPVDGSPFRMFMPDRLRDAKQRLHPVPWNLSDIPERLSDAPIRNRDS